MKVLLVTATALMLLTTGFLTALHAQDMGTRLAATCSQCHPAVRVCANLNTRNEAQWNDLVSRMVAKGARLPAADIPMAAAYLTTASKDTSALCK